MLFSRININTLLEGLLVNNILKSSWWGLVQSELPWEQNFYSRGCVSYRTIGLQSLMVCAANWPR